jgi:uncharacterized membrane protein
MNFSSLERSLYNLLQKSPFDLGFFHPYVVDFAIVLPIMALFFHFVSILLASGDKGGSEFQKAANLMFFGSFVVIIFAYITGIAQGNDLRDSLSKTGQGAYDAHAVLGTYLALGFSILLFLKIISMLVKKDAVRYLFGTIFFFIVLLIIYEDVLGVSLVYDYGAGVVAVP